MLDSSEDLYNILARKYLMNKVVLSISLELMKMLPSILALIILQIYKIISSKVNQILNQILLKDL